MEGSGGFFPFGGGDPEDLLGALREFAESSRPVQEAQREQFATLTLSTAVELTAAALGQLQVDGPSDAQALALRDAMRVLFPRRSRSSRQPVRASCASRDRRQRGSSPVDDDRLTADHLRVGRTEERDELATSFGDTRRPG